MGSHGKQAAAMALAGVLGLCWPLATGAPAGSLSPRSRASEGHRVAEPRQEADLHAGRSLYEAHCARCHGMEGGGGEGPRLAVAELQRAADLESLQRIISAGIPGTPMQELWVLDRDDVRDVAAYVRSLGRNEVTADELPGDPAEGKALYDSMDCSSCHIIDGEGGSLGPVLTEIGYLRSLEHLREALVDPGAALPQNPDPAVGSVYLPVTVETRDGRRISGTRVNEDTFTIQVRDEEDVYHSIRKEEITRLEKRLGDSLMPSYADRLSEEGIDALVAYLATLRGGS